MAFSSFSAYDFVQNLRIARVDNKATKIDQKADFSKIDIRQMQEHLNYVSMVTLALCELLMEQGVSKDRIMTKIREIDMRDGRIDNKTA